MPRDHLRVLRRLAVTVGVAGLVAGVFACGSAHAEADASGTVWAAVYAAPATLSESRRPPLPAGRLVVAAAVDRHAARAGIPAAVLHRLVKRESGYNPRAVGPRTRYGRAYGPTQILCSTARSLGERDCGRLLRDPDRAVELAAVYLRQGYDATGSWRGAAAWYHGGPRVVLHGRKTRAYALAVAG